MNMKNIAICMFLIVSPVFGSQEDKDNLRNEMNAMSIMASNYQIGLLGAVIQGLMTKEALDTIKQGVLHEYECNEKLLLSVEQYIQEAPLEALSVKSMNLLSIVPIDRLMSVYPIAAQRLKEKLNK